MGVSKNNGIPKSSISIGFSIINHPFWGSPIFRNTHIRYEGYLFQGIQTLSFFFGIGLFPAEVTGYQHGLGGREDEDGFTKRRAWASVANAAVLGVLNMAVMMCCLLSEMLIDQ